MDCMVGCMSPLPYAHMVSCIHAPVPSSSRSLSPPPAALAYSYLVPGHYGWWVAFNDSIKLCYVPYLYLHILNSDLHGWGPWERREESMYGATLALHSPRHTANRVYLWSVKS